MLRPLPKSATIHLLHSEACLHISGMKNYVDVVLTRAQTNRQMEQDRKSRKPESQHTCVKGGKMIFLISSADQWISTRESTYHNPHLTPGVNISSRGRADLTMKSKTVKLHEENSIFITSESVKIS